MRTHAQQILIVFIAIMCCFSQTLHAGQGDVYSFPVYKISIAPEHLSALQAYPNSNTSYPATLTYEDVSIPCTVRYRGATSRKYPKKSWKIDFEGNDNIFHAEELNLNAEYIDTSFLRNYLTNQLFSYADIPAPACSFINLAVNDEDMGVYVQIEQIDEYFLEKHGGNQGKLYKAVKHTANMAPLAHDRDYPLVWEPKEGTGEYFRDLKDFFSKAYYWSDSDFEEHISDVLQVRDFIRYYAVLFSIASSDNYTKNMYLHLNPDTGRFEVIPWDNDATFGISWEGVYYEALESFIYGSYLDYQIVFRRLMEHDNWRALFWSDVRDITTNGFSYLNACIEDIVDDLRHDVSLDSHKPGTDEDFTNAVEQLKTFMSNRAAALENASGFDQPPLKNLQIIPSFLESGQTQITVRATSDKARNVTCRYIDNLDYSSIGGSYEWDSIALFDDGLHHDEEAGDHIYGNIIQLQNGFDGYIPIVFESSALLYPRNGFLNINAIRNHSLVVNAMNQSTDEIANLSIRKCYGFAGERFVEIVNTSPAALDMSFTYLQYGAYYNRTLFPENTVIESNQRIIAATDSLLASFFFDDAIIHENEIAGFEIGDTVALLAPDFSVIDEYTFETLDVLNVQTDNVMINEINYHSSPDFESGDWIELYNKENYPVDVTGWIISDSEDSHRFEFPSQTIIASDGYIVVARDNALFEKCFPDAPLVDGEMDFGLDGSGELVRLYDHRMVLVDSVSYDDTDPWPENADGGGAALALIYPSKDNALPEHWGASLSHGTPGERNDIYNNGEHVDEEAPGDGLSSQGNFPNPFNEDTSISFSLDSAAHVRIDVYNISGQHIKTILDRRMYEGTHTAVFSSLGFPAGVYLYSIRTDRSEISRKMVILK